MDIHRLQLLASHDQFRSVSRDFVLTAIEEGWFGDLEDAARAVADDTTRTLEERAVGRLAMCCLGDFVMAHLSREGEQHGG